jgi:HSP20 family protein
MQRFLEEVLPEWDEAGLSMGAWNPKVDMFWKEDHFIVEAELPGVKKEDIDVRVEDHRLILRGESHEEKKTSDESYFRHERRMGNFLRSLMLPNDVSAEKVDAAYKDGVLRLTFPMREEVKAKKIAVK